MIVGVSCILTFFAAAAAAAATVLMFMIVGSVPTVSLASYTSQAA